MEPSLFRYIFRYSRPQQILLLVLTAASFPFLYMTLELPKIIINKAIAGTDFPRILFGFTFGQVEYLLLLCFAFLGLVLVNGGFKYWINVFKGQLGERMLRRLRYQLYSRVLRFPLPQFRRVSQGEIIAMITTEGEPLGGFFGDAFAWPAFQGGTLLTILTFMFVQDWILGLAAIALYPIQIYVIPKLQRRVNALAKERVRTVRKLSERIGESVTGIQEIHANDTSELERADFANRVGRIYDIRYKIYRLKFFIKFLNNFLAQLTPFFFYAIGGYLVIAGDLTFGALVAILAAYKDLSGPWKELLRYYQMKEDARIKYEQLVEQFQPAGILDEELQTEEPEDIPDLEGTVIATNLVLEEEGGIKVVDGATFSFDARERTAILGASGAGRSALARILARLLLPTGGTIRIGGHNLLALPQSVTGRRIAYVDENAFLFAGTVLDNLFYGLKHRPLRAAELIEEEAKKVRSRYVSEARASGNTTSDFNADWVDYESAGVSNPEELRERVIEVLRIVEFDDAIYRMGLQSTSDPVARPDLAGRILEAREVLHKRLNADENLSKLVEPFEGDRYNENLSVAENLLFGTPIGDAFDLDRLGENAYVLEVLEKVGLTQGILETGASLAGIMVELFQDLPADHEYFERFSFISADEIPEFQHVVRRTESTGLDGLEQAERSMLMSLPFKLIPARHRLGLIDDDLRHGLLEARKVFAADLPPGLRPSVAFFDRSEYNAAAPVQDNILFGRLVYGRQQSEQMVGALISEVVDSLDLRRSILDLGLNASVGIGGGRLTVGQRQRLALARCLLKRPDILVVNGGLSALAPATQTSIMKGVFDELAGRGVIWVLNRADQARFFDRALIMEGGRIRENGRVSELDQPGGVLERMAAAE